MALLNVGLVDDVLQPSRLAGLGMTDDEAIENKSLVLLTKAKDIAGLYHDRLDNVIELTAYESCVHQELERDFGFLAEDFLPEADPELESQASVKLSLLLGIKKHTI